MSQPNNAQNREPTCCGEPMLRNAWTEMYECSAAFNFLDEALGNQIDADPLGWRDPTTDYERDQLTHWSASFVPFAEALGADAQ